MGLGLARTVTRVVDRLARPIGVVPSSFLSGAAASLGAPRASVDFEGIYEKNHWGSAESLSGPGSELSYTKSYRGRLVKAIRELGLRSIFDAPSGDMNWIGDVIQQTKIDYQGGDISQKAVELAREKHPDLPNRVFDICADDFPAVDAWHCRDCFFHLSYADAFRALDQYRKSGIGYAMITSHHAIAMRNRDITTGQYRILDLQRAPFNFPRPIKYLWDFRLGVDFPRYVGVWSAEQLSNLTPEK